MGRFSARADMWDSHGIVMSTLNTETVSMQFLELGRLRMAGEEERQGRVPEV